jgi:hypothetical protein
MSFVIKHVTDLLPQWIQSLNLEQTSNPGFRPESIFVSLCMRTLLPNIGPITPQKLPIRGAWRMKDFKDSRCLLRTYFPPSLPPEVVLCHLSEFLVIG